MRVFSHISFKREHDTGFAYGPFSARLVAGYGSDRSYLGETTAETREGFIQNSSDLAHSITGEGLILDVVRNIVINLPFPQVRRVVLQFPAGEGWDAVRRAAEKLPSSNDELFQ